MLSHQGVQPQALEVSDFSGGITDNILGANNNKYEEADNFYINKVGNEGKLVTRPGLMVHDTSNARVTTNKKINSFVDVNSQLFEVTNKRIYYNSSGFTHVSGPSSNDAFSAGDEHSFYAITKWNYHAIMANDSLSNVVKLFKDGSTWKVHQLGLPATSGTETYNVSGGVGRTYLYAYNYWYNYTSNGVTFEEQGPLKFSASQAAGDPSVNNIIITFPAGFTISNGATGNYDTSNIKIKIWRTTDGGSTFYLVNSSSAHNAVSYTDSTSDASLVLNEVLYTRGDVPDHEQPPQCKFVHQVNDILCLGYVKEGSVTYPNKARFSNRFSLWSCPSEFYEEFDQEIKGISSFSTYPIYFCDKKVYRIEGYYLPDGSGGVVKKVISETAGCVSNRSIVQTEIGVFWMGNDGFYWTDGYRVQRISEDLNVTYADLVATANQKARPYGTYNPKLQTIHWVVQADSAASDNDSMYLVHLKAGVSANMPFTTWSGGDDHGTNYSVTSVHTYSDVLYHADTNGYILYYDDDALDDVKVDTSVSAASWLKYAIKYDLRSISFDFGTTALRKWVPWISCVADNASSISMLISANNDNSNSYAEMAEVSFRGNVAWGDFSVAWADASLRWDYFPVLTFKRRFPSPIRCTYKQVRFSNYYATIGSDADLGTATFNGTTNTAVIATDWPDNITDYYISTAADGYDTEFRVSAQSTVTITVEDPTNALPTGTYAWVLKGYRKGEILKIISYSIRHSTTSPSQEPYRP